MFTVAILVAVLLIGAVLALMITRANHTSRAGRSGVAAENVQKQGVGQPAPKRAMGDN